MKKISYENFFVNFSNKTKLKIMTALMEGPMSVSELVGELKEEQSKISHNLENLRKCSILKVRKDGKRRIYSLNKRTVGPMLELVKKHVYGCGGSCAECGLCSGAK